MLDIDRFKNINDTFGHDEGDRVLKELGDYLNQFGRQSDLVARYGGEEFLLVLPDTDIDHALLLAQRLHKLIAKIQIGNKPLTASMGISFNRENNTFENIFKEADIALYKAKELGRNRTVLSGIK